MKRIFRDFSADATGRGLENEPKSLAEQVKRRGAAVRPAGTWRRGVCVAAQCNAFRRSADAARVCRSAMQSIQPGVPECFLSPRARSLLFSCLFWSTRHHKCNGIRQDRCNKPLGLPYTLPRVLSHTTCPEDDRPKRGLSFGVAPRRPSRPF